MTTSRVFCALLFHCVVPIPLVKGVLIYSPLVYPNQTGTPLISDPRVAHSHDSLRTHVSFLGTVYILFRSLEYLEVIQILVEKPTEAG